MISTVLLFVTFAGRFSLNDNPVIVANDIINTLQVYPPKYSTDSPIKEWIDKAESKGISMFATNRK